MRYPCECSQKKPKIKFFGHLKRSSFGWLINYEYEKHVLFEVSKERKIEIWSSIIRTGIKEILSDILYKIWTETWKHQAIHVIIKEYNPNKCARPDFNDFRKLDIDFQNFVFFFYWIAILRHLVLSIRWPGRGSEWLVSTWSLWNI